MKRIMVLLGLVWMLPVLRAEEPVVTKRIIYFTGTGWCGPCAWFERNILSTSNIQSLVYSRFAFERVDVARDFSSTPRGEELMLQYKVRYVPRLVLTMMDGTWLEDLSTDSASNLEERLNVALGIPRGPSQAENSGFRGENTMRVINESVTKEEVPSGNNQIPPEEILLAKNVLFLDAWQYEIWRRLYVQEIMKLDINPQLYWERLKELSPQDFYTGRFETARAATWARIETLTIPETDEIIFSNRTHLGSLKKWESPNPESWNKGRFFRKAPLPGYEAYAKRTIHPAEFRSGRDILMLDPWQYAIWRYVYLQELSKLNIGRDEFFSYCANWKMDHQFYGDWATAQTRTQSRLLTMTEEEGASVVAEAFNPKIIQSGIHLDSEGFNSNYPFSAFMTRGTFYWLATLSSLFLFGLLGRLAIKVLGRSAQKVLENGPGEIPDPLHHHLHLYNINHAYTIEGFELVCNGVRLPWAGARLVENFPGAYDLSNGMRVLFVPLEVSEAPPQNSLAVSASTA
jgi:hypothetical protein